VAARKAKQRALLASCLPAIVELSPGELILGTAGDRRQTRRATAH
jgi:hypothetical protein